MPNDDTRRGVKILRKALEQLDNEEDKRLFKKTVANEPGRGGPINRPEANGFISIKGIFEGDTNNKEIAEIVRTTGKNEKKRVYMFKQIVGIVHRLAPNFEIYLGRTYVREGKEHLGPVQRWSDHYTNREMKWAKPLFLVPRERIIRDERVGLTLINVWKELGALCCNNSVMLAQGNISNDPWQMIYLCLKEKKKKRRRS